MTFPLLAFQVFNLNDYDVKLFPNFEENQLYISRINILEKYPQLDSSDDSGSSQRPDKILFESAGEDKSTLKNFPFNALFRSEINILKLKSSKLSNYVALFDSEYNYILILYPTAIEVRDKIVEYFTTLKVPSQEIESFNDFIQFKIDELDNQILKESRGERRLQKKINPKVTKNVQLLQDHIKILSEDAEYGETYIKLINEFDHEFLHYSEEDNTFVSTITQKDI